MAAPTASITALGFLTVIEHQQHGLFGSYLVLNLAGRPLEFHCTAPVKPTRAQQILFGPTLKPFLYGEQIGATLVNKSQLDAVALLTDNPAMLAVRDHVDVPTALVLQTDSAPEAEAEHLTVGARHLLVAKRYLADRKLLVERLAAVADTLDLNEPFGRIREAIDEANRAAKAA